MGLATCISLFVCGVSTAQSPDPEPAASAGSGAIVGFVTDPDRARLPGVVVTITEVNTRSTLTVITGDHGGFRGTNLPPGRYELKAELAGFQTHIVQDLALSGRQTREVNFTLPLAAYTESVTVVGASSRESLQSPEIRDSAARDIGEALSHMNGVSKIRKGGIGNDVVLHGYQGKDLTVLIDGQKIHGACPNGMDPAVFHADFAEVDHVEVGKGPFDMLNQGSLGGVVNIVTRRPADGFHVEPTLSVGAFGYFNPSGTFSFGGRRIALLNGYSYRASEPYRDGSGARFTELANYRPGDLSSRAFGAHTGWSHLLLSPRTGHAIRVSYTRQQADHVLYPYLQMDAVADDADRLRVGYHRASVGGVVETLSADAFYARVVHSMSDDLRTSSIGSKRAYSMETLAESIVAGGKVQAGRGGLNVGIEGSRRTWSATTSLMANQFQPQHSIPDVATDGVGVFAAYTRSLTAGSQIEIGGRLDVAHSVADEAKANTNLYFAYHGTRSTSASDVMPSGKIRLTHRFSEHLKVGGGVGHTERVPDPRERYFGLARMGIDWVGNPALPPTGNTGISADVAFQHGRLAATAGLYRDWLDDFVTLGPRHRINSVPGVMNARAQSYGNVSARMTSGEASLTYSLSGRLFATAQAAYTRGTKDATPGLGLTSNNMPEIPPFRGSLSVRYDRVTIFGEAELVATARQSRVDADLLEDPTPGYAVLNVRVGRQIQRLRVSVNVDNVLDRRYLDFTSYRRDPFRSTVRVYEPGRNLYLNVSYRY